MESLFDILSNRLPDEPPEIRVVKEYVRKHFKENVNVAAREREIVVTVRSSALAGALRTRTAAINKELTGVIKPGSAAGIQKRLVFRIGSVE